MVTGATRRTEAQQRQVKSWYVLSVCAADTGLADYKLLALSDSKGMRTKTHVLHESLTIPHMGSDLVCHDLSNIVYRFRRCSELMAICGRLPCLRCHDGLTRNTKVRLETSLIISSASIPNVNE